MRMSMQRVCVYMCNFVCVLTGIWRRCEQHIASTAVASHGCMEAGRFISSRQTPRLLPQTNNSIWGTSGSNENHYTKFGGVCMWHESESLFVSCCPEFLWCKSSMPCACDLPNSADLTLFTLIRGQGTQIGGKQEKNITSITLKCVYWTTAS